MYFHEEVARALSRQGVQHLFGLLGVGNLHIVRCSVDECGGFVPVCCRHRSPVALLVVDV